jgi:hypothetical protein
MSSAIHCKVGTILRKYTQADGPSTCSEVFDMSSGVDACPEHHERTRSERQLRYCFYIKHHGGTPKAAQWADDLSRNDEFAIFDEADLHQISDDGSNLYGLRRGVELSLLDLGTRGEQIAKFWEVQTDQPWHGFPLWHLKGRGPDNRKTKLISKDVLKKMEQAGLISSTECKRLGRGDRA